MFCRWGINQHFTDSFDALPVLFIVPSIYIKAVFEIFFKVS